MPKRYCAQEEDLDILTKSPSDCFCDGESLGSCTYVTNSGPEEPVDQRKIETIPAPAPEPSVIAHAKRESYVVEDELYRFQYPALLGETAPPSITELDDELRGASPGFIAGFTEQDLDDDASPEFRSEHNRGEMARLRFKLLN